MGFGKGGGFGIIVKYTPLTILSKIYNIIMVENRYSSTWGSVSRWISLLGAVPRMFTSSPVPSLTFCHIVPSLGLPCWGDPRIELVDGDLFCRHNTPYSVDIGFYIQPNFWGASQLERMLIVMFCFIYSDPAINPVDANTMMPWWYRFDFEDGP